MKRFYREATLGEVPGGFGVLLDGRAVRTQGGRPQIVPSRALGEALVAEWAQQGETIDTTTFAFRDLADYAIDVIAPDPAAAIGALAAYAETDTLCYRAEPDEPFAERQRACWEPLVSAAEARLGVQFVRVAGIMPRPQPIETVPTIAAHCATLDPFVLSALRAMSSLAASLIIGLAALEPDADVAALWDAANLEEDWQAELWGKDAEAEARRAHRQAQFVAAARFAVLVK